MTMQPIAPATRSEVYAAIDGERAYQEGWNDPELTDSGGRHSNVEFLAMIQYYTNNALGTATIRPDPAAKRETADALRKIAALAVAAMEQNGVCYRNTSDNLKARHP